MVFSLHKNRADSLKRLVQATGAIFTEFGAQKKSESVYSSAPIKISIYYTESKSGRI
jgi:uncharacterized protein YbaA (DUF1428 family)